MADTAADKEPDQVLHTPKEPVLRNCKSGCGGRHAGPWGGRCKLLVHNGGTIRRRSENVPDRDDSSGEETDAAGGDGRAPGEIETAPGEEPGRPV